MEPILQSRIAAGMAFAAVTAHESSRRFGYWEKPRDIVEAIARLHQDASRALEVATLGDGPSKDLHDITRLEEALADVIIRALDISIARRLSIAAAVVAKLHRNEQLSKLVRKDF